jgi:hypothetical protein
MLLSAGFAGRDILNVIADPVEGIETAVGAGLEGGAH